MYLRREEYETMPVRRYGAGEDSWQDDTRATSIEQLLKVEVNGELLTEALCSPGHQLDLAVGMAVQRGLVRSMADIADLELIDGTARLSLTALAAVRSRRGEETPRYYNLSRLRAWQGRGEAGEGARVQARAALQTADKLLGELAVTHARTNGVHSGVLYDSKSDRIMVFREDIGRHNVFDKLCGWAFRQGVPLQDKLLVFSGRCSTEMVLKLWRMDCRMVLAKSVPTTLSLEMADKLGITLMGRLTREGFSVYTHDRRVI